MTEGSLPVTVMISAANIHEGTKLIPLMKSISIETGHRPRKRPKVVYADTKYATPLNRFYLDKKQIRSQIPDSPLKTKKRPGRPRVFDKEMYRGVRYNVERLFGWLKAFRRIIIRYERLPSTFLGFVQLGCVVILLRYVSR